MPYIGFVLGLKLCLNNHFSDFYDLLDIIKSQEVTVFSGVPTLLQGIKQELSQTNSKYKNIKNHLKRVLTGGSSCPPDLLEWYYNHLNVDIIHCWGIFCSLNH